MPKICTDFTYQTQPLKDLGFTTLDFNQTDEIPLFLQRDLIKGETNLYRHKANHIRANFTDHLELEFNIVKQNYRERSQTDLTLTKDDIRTITRWLTSVSRPASLVVMENDTATHYNGIFTNIETFVAGGQILGLTLTFTNDSPFAYTPELTETISVNGHTPHLINNHSDLLDDYSYPLLQIEPQENTDFFLCNLSDTQILESGTLTLSENSGQQLEQFLNLITHYGETRQYTTQFYYNDQNMFKTWADDTAIAFKYQDQAGIIKHCFAFYQPDGTYHLLEGGYFACRLLKDLPFTMDNEHLTLYDGLNRMILFPEIGMAEEDYIYWPRLKSGSNSLLFCGNNLKITITRREMLKTGGI